MYHSGETSLPHLQCQVQLPGCAINVGEGVSIADVQRALGRPKCLLGNFDPILLRDGTPEQIAEEAGRMVRANLSGGHYVFNTGEGVMYTTPEANVEAMMRAARRATDELHPPASATSRTSVRE